MVIDIERIREDLDEARLMDIDAEIEKRIADLRDEIEGERDAKVAELEKLLELVEEYEVLEADEDEEEECEDEDNEEEVALEDVIPTAEE